MTETVDSIAEMIRTDKIEEAREAIDEIQVTDQNRGDVSFLRALWLERSYQYDAALEAYVELVDQDSDNPEVIFRAARLADLLGDDEQAMALYEMSAGSEHARANVVVNLALLYEDCGKFDDAKRCLDTVLLKYPDHRRAKQFLKSVESSYDMYYDEKSHRDREQQYALLDTPVTDFELSVRSRNCLRQMNIRSLGDLLRTTEAELLSYKNFGETSLNEIKAMLAQKELDLGQTMSTVDASVPPTPASVVNADVNVALNKPISELELSVRSRRCLQALGVHTLGDLCQKTEAELMTIKNFGETSMVEIKNQVSLYSLSLRR